MTSSLLFEAFCAQVFTTPDKLAIQCGDLSITYKGLLSLVGKFIAAEKAISTSKWIVTNLPTTIDGVSLLLACAARNLSLVPTADEAMGRRTADLISSFEEAIYQEPRPFLVLSTSGTTSDAKLISLSQKTKLLRAKQFSMLYGVTDKDTVLIGTPLHTSMAQRLLFVSLFCGASIVMLPKYSPELWLEAAKKCTVVVGVPSQLQNLTSDTRSIELVLSSSAPRIDDCGRLAETLYNRGVDYRECYGASEIAIATEGPVGKSVGKSAGPVLLTIDDNTEEILVYTGLLHDGYFGRPDLTKDSLTDAGFFKTGDAGRLERGYLHLSGRLNDRIKVGATTVWPEDVEKVVRTYPGVLDCAATPSKDDKLGEVVAVHVVAEEPIKLRALQKYCLDKMDDAQLPRKCFEVKSIPRTELGKIQRRKLL